MFRLLAAVLGLVVDIFYRRVAVGGPPPPAVPPAGPVLLVANHPNGLIDPVVVLRAAGRFVRMLAKAPLFEMPGISLIVKALGALPVYRSKDGADTAQNAATFAAVSAALGAGDAVLIFPEGISHDEPQLQKLKTGAARMALAALDAGATGLVVVPVGLTYRDKARFRSEVATLVGPPLALEPYRDVGGDGAERVRRLTDDIATALRDVTVNLERWEDLPLLEAVDAIWRIDDPQRAARLKELADGVALLRADAPEQLAAARARVVEWVARLDELGLAPLDFAPEHSAARSKPARALRFAVSQLVVAVVLLPVATFGALFFAPPFWTVHALAVLSRPSPDVAATVKVVASLVLFPLWHALAIAALWLALSPGLAIGVALLAPLCGMTTRWFFRSRRRALRDAAVFARLLFSRRLARRLEHERDALLVELDALGARVEALRSDAAPNVSASGR